MRIHRVACNNTGPCQESAYTVCRGFGRATEVAEWGPILAGALTSFGWRTVFWFNVPIGILGTIAAAALLVEQVRPPTRQRFDVVGTVICVVGLTGLMAGLAFGGIYGWTTPWVLGGFVTFLVALPLFVWVEQRRPDPLLDLGLFRDRLFATGNLTSLLNGIARNGVLFLLVFISRAPVAMTR